MPDRAIRAGTCFVARRRGWFFWGAACLGVALVGCNRAGTVLPQAVQAAPPASGIPYAPTAPEPRRGQWDGGPPPINKSAAGISVYYRISPAAAPNVLTVQLRFEGAVAPDARVRLGGVDGARFEPASQPVEWRLAPGVPAEVTVTVAVPVGDSYLSFFTEQRGRGASHAILLKMAR